MKKLIMFVMVLAISAPSLADDLNPPDWAGAPGTIYGIWNFDEESPSGDTGDPAIRDDYPEEGEMVPHDTHPDPEELTETSDTEGAHKYMIEGWTEGWEWFEFYEGRDGVMTADVGWEFLMNNFEGSGTKLIRIQITWWPSEEAEFVEWYWSWNDEDGEEGPEDPTDYLVAEIADVGDGWRHSTYEIEISDNPFNEGIWVGTWGNNTAIDQIVIDTICYPGDEPPVGPGRIVVKPPVTVDSNDIPIYEPADADGPPVLGPTEGQLLVSLGWQPGEGLGYPAFTATVVVDPNEGTSHNDFVFPAGEPKPDQSGPSKDDPYGFVTLTFDQDNWDDPQEVIVEAVEDLDREGNENYPIELTVTIDIADPNFGNPTPVVVGSRVGVVDNDVPFISAIPDEIELSENDPCTCVDLKIRLSHKPWDDVYVRVYAEEWAFEEEMVFIDPPLVPDGPDPNKLTFTTADDEAWVPGTMTSGWNVEQTVTVCPIDNDELAEAWIEWIGGDIWIPGFSEDVRYRVPWFDAEGNDVEDSGGELDEVYVEIAVQDNECGAVGFDAVDYNEDCRVGLGDFVEFYAQWLLCTNPFDAGVNQWGDCDAVWNLVEEEE